MDTTFWIAAVLFTVFGCCTGQIQLTINPAGEIKEGDVVKLTCNKPNAGPFDVIKILRKAGDRSQEVLVNLQVNDAFVATGRYSFLAAESDFSQGKLVLQINGVTGADAGTFECLDLASGQGAEESITVAVPPSSVVIKYQNDVGSLVEAAENENVVFTADQPYKLVCEVSVSGSTEQPIIKLTKNGVNVDSSFNRAEISTGQISSILLNEIGQSISLTDKAGAVDVNDNGKAFVCSAKMPNHDTELSKSITMEVHYPPAIVCDPAKVKAGDEVTLTCTATMFPVFNSAKWSWTSAGDGQTIQELQPDGESQDGNFHFMHRADGESHTFQLHIKEAKSADFVSYTLMVGNGVGPEKSETVTLQEELTTTRRTSPKPSTRGSGGNGIIDNNNPSGAANTPQMAALAIVTSLLLAIAHLL